MVDFADRSLGIGYTGGTSVLLVFLLVSLAFWYTVEGTVSVTTLNRPRAEVFYWLTIMFSQTLGTALGDWVAGTSGLGYLGAAVVFGGGLVLLAVAYYSTNLSRVVLFWAAFILTRPLGVTVVDFFNKPLNEGGLAVARPVATEIIAAVMFALILLIPQKFGEHLGKSQGAV